MVKYICKIVLTGGAVMNMDEFLTVKDFGYSEYCDYLQDKYGIGLSDYMYKSFYKKAQCRRTKEGLISHHKMEYYVPCLSDRDVAKMCPFEWQMKENIVYCDFLEHLLLHVLICKFPSSIDTGFGRTGVQGATAFIIPELNDLYSGWITEQDWRKSVHDRVKDDKDVYLKIIEMLIVAEKDDKDFNLGLLCHSFNGFFGYWSDDLNRGLYDEIEMIYDKIMNT